MTEATAEHDSHDLCETVRTWLNDLLPPSLRSDLVIAAATMIAAADRPSPTMRDIAKHAGVAVGTSYNEFASRDELFAATKDAVVTAISFHNGAPLPHDEFVHRLQHIFGTAGGLPRFLADHRHPLVPFPAAIIERLSPRDFADTESVWRPDVLSQALLACLDMTRTSHPLLMASFIEHHLLDLSFCLQIAKRHRPFVPDDRLLERLRSSPFTPRFASKWTEGLARLLADKPLGATSLSELSRSVGVSPATGYRLTTLSEVAVALQLEAIQALLRGLDELDDPAQRLTGLQVRASQAATEQPWFVEILRGAHVDAPADWREPDLRPVEAWIELQVRILHRLGRVRPPFDNVLAGYSGLACAPIGLHLSIDGFDAARAWPLQVAGASIRPVSPTLV